MARKKSTCKAFYLHQFFFSSLTNSTIPDILSPLTRHSLSPLIAWSCHQQPLLFHQYPDVVSVFDNIQCHQFFQSISNSNSSLHCHLCFPSITFGAFAPQSLFTQINFVALSHLQAIHHYLFLSLWLSFVANQLSLSGGFAPKSLFTHISFVALSQLQAIHHNLSLSLWCC